MFGEKVGPDKMDLTWFCLLNLVFAARSRAQSFQQFGSYEYYWSTIEDNYVESYSEAEDQCRQMNATLALVNTREVGEFFDNKIGIVPCK